MNPVLIKLPAAIIAATMYLLTLIPIGYVIQGPENQIIEEDIKMEYRGIVSDDMKTMDDLKTNWYNTYKEAHDAAERLCKRTMGDRGSIDVEEKTMGGSKMKTYYSVTYSVWGADSPKEAWFDNKEEAEKFAAHDYRNDPVAHRCSKPEKIEEYDELVAMTNWELSNN